MIENKYKMGYTKMFDRITRSTDTIPCKHTLKQTVEWIIDDMPDYCIVLDFGCFNGTFGGLGDIFVRNKHLQVDGLDIDLENEKAHYHSMAEVKGYYDIIVMSHVLEHCERDDVISILNWASDHCNTLYITVPNAGDNINVNFWCDTTHVQPYNIPEIREWCWKANFNISVLWSCLGNNIPFYSKLYRILDAKLRYKSPFEDYTIICKRRDQHGFKADGY